MNHEEFRKMAEQCADNVLKAAGSGLINYSMAKTRENIINAALDSLYKANEAGFRHGMDVASERLTEIRDVIKVDSQRMTEKEGE